MQVTYTKEGSITMNMKWSDMTPLERVGLIVCCIAAFAVALALRYQSLFPVDITCPAIAVATAFEALAYWKKNRKLAYLLLAGTVVSLAFFVLELCLS